MIAALSLALQLAVTQQAAPRQDRFVVKDAERQTTVVLVEGPSGPSLRPEQLAPVLEVSVRRLGGDRYLLSAGGVDVEMRVGSPIVRIGDESEELNGAPYLRGSALYIPLQVVSELLPRVARTGIIWDEERRELRRFSTVRRQPPPAPAAALPAASGSLDEIPNRPSPGRATVPVTHSGPRRPGAARRVVVVDAGHGGPDRGMHGPLGGGFVIFEKDITLQVARRLSQRLRAAGVEVVQTRTSDTLIALSDRGRIANEANGDLFISVHVNAANMSWKNPGGARGFETYFLAEARTEDARRVEQMENEAIRFETNATARKGDPLSFILNDMAQNEHLRESAELAEAIQRRLHQMHPGPNRGVKQAGFRVLVTAFMPAVLVEIGFGTNAAEAAYLSDGARQEELAAAIADAALAYLERYERRVGGGGEE